MSKRVWRALINSWRLKRVKQTEDRFERMEIKFHERLRQGFLNIAKSDPARCRVINADQDIDVLFNKVKDSVSLVLKKQSVVEEFTASPEERKE